MEIMWKRVSKDEAIRLESEGRIVRKNGHDGVLIDYKTTSNLNPPEEIPSYYRYQLLAYAYMYNKMGIPINRIRIVWITNNVVGRISEKTGKPMKDYPATVGVCTETITNEDLDFIESIFKLICETVEAYQANPSLAYLLFKDYRLKGHNGS